MRRDRFLWAFWEGAIDQAESQVGYLLEIGVYVEDCAVHRRMVEHEGTRRPRRQAIGEALYRNVAERIVQIDREIAGRKPKLRGIAANDSHVFAGRLGARTPPAYEVFTGDLAERRRDFDAHDLLERILRRQQNDASQTRPDVDEDQAARRNGKRSGEHSELRHRRGLVMRRVGKRIADGVGIEIAQEDDAFGRDAVRRIEALSASFHGAADVRRMRANSGEREAPVQ